VNIVEFHSTVVIKVFTWGHPGIKERRPCGGHGSVSGREACCSKYIFYNEIEARNVTPNPR